jgi:drug/metabolite transporter (DMT)-like permease
MKRYSYYIPVIIIVFSNALYDISAKAFPEGLNAQAGLTAYYIIAAVVSLLLFYLTSKEKDFPAELKKVTWATFTLALGCTGIDLGYVLLFRAGWNISYGSLACNIMIATTLILVGKIFFHEYINKYHLIGISLCLTGFALINL